MLVNRKEWSSVLAIRFLFDPASRIAVCIADIKRDARVRVRSVLVDTHQPQRFGIDPNAVADIAGQPDRPVRNDPVEVFLVRPGSAHVVHPHGPAAHFDPIKIWISFRIGFDGRQNVFP